MWSDLTSLEYRWSRVGCRHVPARFGKKFFDHVDRTVGTAVDVALTTMEQLVVQEIDSVLLSGPPGCGKTLLVAATCNENEWERLEPDAQAERAQKTPKSGHSAYETWQDLLEAEREADRGCAQWISVPTVLEALKREMSATDRPTTRLVKGALASSGLLVLDDLGSEKATEWTLGVLFDLVATAYDSGRQILITSNLTDSQLDAAGYKRIVSRVAEGGCLLDMTSARDYRMTHLRRSVTGSVGE